MNIGSLGDLAQNFAMQNCNGAIKQDLQRLTTELSTGQVADLRSALGGNVAYLTDLDRSLKKLDGYDLATLEASQFAGSVQGALGRIESLGTAFRNTLIMSATTALGAADNSIVLQARTGLDDLVSALNTDIAGRSIFGGTATATPPVAAPRDLLAGLSAAVAGAGTVDDIIAASQSWFADPAGFGTVGYLGSGTSLAPVAVSDTATVEIALRADDPALRETVRNFALVALADDPALGLSVEQKSELFQKTTNSVFSAQASILDLRVQVGFTEERLDALTARHGAERSALQIARNDLLSVDPFQSATELEQVQFQLQSLYAITSRMSQLSLVNFL